MKANVITLSVICLFGAVAVAQTEDAPAPELKYVGRVTGDSVYVRSGPDTNYYALGKVNSGQTVRVFGQQFGWLQIEPLPEMYSLIEENYLDVTSDGRGVVNADHVNVRAGADSTPHVYARQMKLDRGAQVRVLGTREATLGGQQMTFYKIEPPAGAYVWISAQYVERAEGDSPPPQPAAALPSEQEATGQALSGTPSGSTPSTPSVSPAPRRAAAPSSAAQMPGPDEELSPRSRELRERLATVEQALDAEFAKPVVERRFESLREIVKELAEQSDDEVVQRFAEMRLDQIDEQISLIRTILALRNEDEMLGQVRQDAMRARAEIRVSTMDTPRSFTLAGELRRSNVYDTPTLPRRYRLVDPSESPARTLAYIEIPQGADFDPVPLLGRYVGITEGTRTYHKGLVEAIPIIVPEEIVIIDRPMAAPEASEPEAEHDGPSADPQEVTSDEPSDEATPDTPGENETDHPEA